MRFSQDFLEAIRARLPISKVVGAQVTWDRRKSIPAKGDFWACCPFHNEKTPSFHVDDRRGRYHCFGCGASGDHFRFLIEKNGASFPEAVERLANEAGLSMPVMSPHEKEREQKRANLYEVIEAAAQFYEMQLSSPKGRTARDYLDGRELDDSIRHKFRIGYAPRNRNALKDHLAAMHITPERMIEAGLLIAGDDIPVSFDRFRDRIMFPIQDLQGRIIAFGGRALSNDAQAKYLNSPETPLFHKRTILYNAKNARSALHKHGTLIAVEGYIDVIACDIAGLENVIAPLGTALSEEQLALMWQWTDEPVLCFDGDTAGIRAAHRAIDLALPHLAPGKTLQFVFLPEGKDPDDLIRTQGKNALAELLERKRPLFEVLWNRETETNNFDTPERRAALEMRTKELIRTIRNEVVRHHYYVLTRERLRTFFRPLSNRQNQSKRNNQKHFSLPFSSNEQKYRATEILNNHPMTSRSIDRHTGLREAILLGAAAHHPDILTDRLEKFTEIKLTSEPLNRLRSLLIDCTADATIDNEQIRKRIATENLTDIMVEITLRLERCGVWQALPEAAFSDVATTWDQAYALHNRARALHMELKSAEIALANDPSDDNLERLLDIQNQLARTEDMEASIE